MTVVSARVGFGTATATLVAENDSAEFEQPAEGRGGLYWTRPRQYNLWNAGAAVCYLGGSAVAGTTGYQLGVGTATSVVLEPGDSVYAIGAGAGTLHVLRMGD